RILSADKGEGRGYTMRTLRGAEWRYTLAQARVGRPTTPSPMTLAVDLQALAPCDSPYVSPHHDDVLLSCRAPLLAAAARGRRILGVAVCGEPGRDWARTGALAQADVRRIALGLPDARRRSDYYGSFRALVEGRRADDDRWLGQVAQVLTDVGHRSRAAE